jgi:hypothetical protein
VQIHTKQRLFEVPSTLELLVLSRGYQTTGWEKFLPAPGVLNKSHQQAWVRGFDGRERCRMIYSIGDLFGQGLATAQRKQIR